MLRLLAGVLMASAGLVPAGEEGDAAGGKVLEKVRLVLQWKHQAQFSGFYMAKEKGLYAKYGLDVQILPRQGRSDPLDLLLEGHADFAAHFLSSGIGIRSTKQPVVLIGQLFNRSHLMMIARRSDGIEKISDLSGKRVAFWEGYYRFVFRALFARYDAVGIIEQPMGLTVTPFTSRRVVACSAMEYNEYQMIRTALGDEAKDLVEFRMRDMGLDFPEDALYTTEAKCREKPDICRRLLAATLEGWEYATNNPDETLKVVADIIANDPDELVSEENSRWMLRICSESVVPPEGSPRSVGKLSRADFDAVKNFLRDNGQIRYDFAYEDFVCLDAAEPPPGL